MNKIILFTIFLLILASLFTSIVFFIKYWCSKQYADFVPVLMYHNVIGSESIKEYSKTKYKDIFISTEKFEKQMNFLKQHNYTTLTLDEFYGFLQGTKKVPKRSVLITFDDGRKNIYINAYPILKKLDYKATVFVITSKNKDITEEYNPLGKQYLSKEELKNGSDVFEYASHTHNMHRRQKSDNKPFLKCKTNEEVKIDLEKSLENVDNKYLAYPYGAYSKNNFKILQELGIKAAFTTRRGKVHQGNSIYKLRRNGIGEHTSDIYFMKILGYIPIQEIVNYLKNGVGFHSGL